jgi:histidine triad (HIT) family protein
MTTECVFCRIVAGRLPADKVFENDTVLAFRDINPVAPTHILLIPRQHIAGPAALDETTAAVMVDLLLAAKAVAAQEGIEASGYRLVLNQGMAAGQSVFHLHMHLIGGRRLRWPPG